MTAPQNAAVVTGCTGAIGNALLRRLADEGRQVFAVVRPDSPRNVSLPHHPAIRQIPCGLDALQTLPERIGCKCECFFHLGWMGTFGDARNAMHMQTANIEAALCAAEAAHALGCRVFIGAGSQAEYGRKNVPLTPSLPVFPENGYGIAKLCAGQMTRQLCDSLGMTHIWMRILSVYGPHDGEKTLVMSVLRDLLAGRTPECTGGEQIWDYLYCEDAAEALCMAARCRQSAVYCLGGGEARPLRDYITEMRDAVDPQCTVAFGARPYAPAQVMYLTADLSALTADTGFVPRTPFPEGIRKTLAWIRADR